MTYTQHSRAGKAKENEDRMMVTSLSQGRLLAVMADGMGGLDNGEIASEIAVNSIALNIQNAKIPTSIDELFINALEKADHEISCESSRVGLKMGCAVAIVLIEDNTLDCVSLGNIRVMCNDIVLTEDNVYVDSVGGTYLTNSLRGRGVKKPVRIIHYLLQAGWHVRICSDGFYNSDETDDASVIDIME